jgi:uncharacterized protein YecT (DUF1311 family)
MTALVTRVLAEKRSLALTLAVALVANILAYAFVVYPLGVKSAGSAERASAAASARQAAEREEAQAKALVTGKAKADEELNAFYQKVLPADQAAARQMTYASLPALARQANVRYEERRFSIENEKTNSDQPAPGPRLGHLVIRMVLQGDYENIRAFIYQLETAPDFVIIDDVTLLEGTGNSAGPGSSAPLTLTVELSTYFRQGPDGA